MIIILRVDTKEEKILVPKGTQGKVVGCQWGDRGDGYVVDFPQNIRIFVPRENITQDKNVYEKSRSQETEGKVGKQKWKKELPAPTVGKGSNDFIE